MLNINHADIPSRSWAGRDDLNKNEYWKLEKDGLEILSDIDRLAPLPFDQIDPSDVEKLKWAGIYAQVPKDGHFLIRVKLPSGRLSAEQARVIADISRDYGEHTIQITIRQCIQIHNITLKDVKDIFQRLDAAGLTSVEGCGDVPRNILGNPLMGIDPEELVDTEPLVDAMVAEFVGNPEYSNLPRKFKISVSANPRDCGFAGINDLAFVPARLNKADDHSVGFHVYVGGGLSAAPRLAHKLSFFVHEGEVLPVAKAVAKIFREDGYRQKRNHARLKFLVDDWGVKKFEDEVEKLTGPLTRGGREAVRKWNRGVYHGIHTQKQAGLYYVGVNVPAGAMTSEDLAEFARIAEVYGDGSLRTTNSQNLIIVNVPKEKTKELRGEELFQRFSLRPGYIDGYAASCTGNQYCNWAPVETKHRLQDLIEEMEDRYGKDLKTPLRINLTGCVHSCAHPQIADIGIMGGLVKVDGKKQPVFTFRLGGSLGGEAQFADRLNGKVHAKDLSKVVSDMIQYYVDHRDNERQVFYQFERAVGIQPFQDILDQYKF